MVRNYGFFMEISRNSGSKAISTDRMPVADHVVQGGQCGAHLPIARRLAPRRCSCPYDPVGDEDGVDGHRDRQHRIEKGGMQARQGLLCAGLLAR
jgi:hypothetical protein